MKALSFPLVLLIISAGICGTGSAQTFAQGSDKTAAQLEALTKKIDGQNTKIDTLSQQLLKLEQQIANIRPGVMIGETASATPAVASPATAASPAAPSGNAHVVAKGETLTSIAKQHNVKVAELQKFNHIENDRALQIGQTIMIPPSGSSPAPTASPPASPNQ
ncbi:MAG TPA: LysM peptidoglycan-binding domain-containing protein [Chthoniobacterales bacterium]|nr:LysM peptidoglycan-binding domain-containing protein [Chthoniobacterales bacterium]